MLVSEWGRMTRATRLENRRLDGSNGEESAARVGAKRTSEAPVSFLVSSKMARGRLCGLRGILRGVSERFRVKLKKNESIPVCRLLVLGQRALEGSLVQSNFDKWSQTTKAY